MVMGIYESKFVVIKHFGCDVLPRAWFSYIVIHRRCSCDFIVGDRRWIKSFVFLKSFSPSVISHNRLATKCDELRYMKIRL